MFFPANDLFAVHARERGNLFVGAEKFAWHNIFYSMNKILLCFLIIWPTNIAGWRAGIYKTAFFKLSSCYEF
jgi:hypothetical protein